MAMAPRWLLFLAHSRVLAGLSVSQQLVSPSVLQLFFPLRKLTSVSLTLDTSLAGFPSTPSLGAGPGGSQSLALATDSAFCLGI